MYVQYPEGSASVCLIACYPGKANLMGLEVQSQETTAVRSPHIYLYGFKQKRPSRDCFGCFMSSGKGMIAMRFLSIFLISRLLRILELSQSQAEVCDAVLQKSCTAADLVG